MRRERITCTLDSHYIIMILCIINNYHSVTSRSADELHNRVKRTGNDLNVSHITNISINSFVPKLNINTWLLHLHWYYSTGVEQHYYTLQYLKKKTKFHKSTCSWELHLPRLPDFLTPPPSSPSGRESVYCRFHTLFHRHRMCQQKTTPWKSRPVTHHSRAAIWTAAPSQIYSDGSIFSLPQQNRKNLCQFNEGEEVGSLLQPPPVLSSHPTLF